MNSYHHSRSIQDGKILESVTDTHRSVPRFSTLRFLFLLCLGEISLFTNTLFVRLTEPHFLSCKGDRGGSYWVEEYTQDVKDLLKRDSISFEGSWDLPSLYRTEIHSYFVVSRENRVTGRPSFTSLDHR